MANVTTNRDMIVTQATERFKENFKMLIAEGASIMQPHELEKCISDVSKEMLSFLALPYIPQSAAAGKSNKKA